MKGGNRRFSQEPACLRGHAYLPFRRFRRFRLKLPRLPLHLPLVCGRIKEDLLKSRAALEEALSRLSGERDDMLDRQLVTNLIVRWDGALFFC